MDGEGRGGHSRSLKPNIQERKEVGLRVSRNAEREGGASPRDGRKAGED